MNKKAFIGGPISHLMSGSGFREEFVTIHKMVMQILRQAGYQILSAHIAEDYGKKKIEPDEVIAERDLTWIDEADVCVFLLPVRSNEAIRTVGTYIEIGYASSKCSNVLCFWDSSNPEFYSPMFRGMTTKNVKIYDISKIREALTDFEKSNIESIS